MAESDFWTRFLSSLWEEESSELSERFSHLHVENTPLVIKSDGDLDSCLAGIVSEEFQQDHDGDYATTPKKKRQQGVSLKASASKWTVDHLTKHIMGEQVDLVTPLCLSEFPDQICVPGFMKNLINCSDQIMDERGLFSEDPNDGLKLWTLPFWEIKEATISILVQNVLGPVCQQLKVIMKPEQNLPKDVKFGTAIVDFALFYEGFTIGVVEIKTPKTLGPDSVAQLLLPLMKLQFKNGDSKMAYIGILTDGFRYVFAKLQGDKFIFENMKSNGDPSINIHRPLKWNDLDKLLKYTRSILYDICQLAYFRAGFPMHTLAGRPIGQRSGYGIFNPELSVYHGHNF